MKRALHKFWSQEDGQDMVEYALLLSFIVVCALAVMTSARGQLTAVWSTINSSFSSAIAGSS